MLCYRRNLTKVFGDKKDEDRTHSLACALLDMVQNRLQQTIFMIESMVKKLDEIAKFRLNRLFYE